MQLKHLLGNAATTLTSIASRLGGRTFAAGNIKPLSRSFYDLRARGLDGTDVDLKRFAGRVSLVVNVASECGFTPQYAGLERLQQTFGARGFQVLAFPSDEFGGQEPGSAEQIRDFCDRNYKVSFPLFGKLRTKAGAGQSPVYARLGESGQLPAWNFHKFLIGRDGQVAAVLPTSVAPESPAVQQAIELALRSEGPFQAPSQT